MHHRLPAERAGLFTLSLKLYQAPDAKDVVAGEMDGLESEGGADWTEIVVQLRDERHQPRIYGVAKRFADRFGKQWLRSEKFWKGETGI